VEKALASVLELLVKMEYFKKMDLANFAILAKNLTKQKTNALSQLVPQMKSSVMMVNVKNVTHLLLQSSSAKISVVQHVNHVKQLKEDNSF
jgi:hypothetical protein